MVSSAVASGATITSSATAGSATAGTAGSLGSSRTSKASPPATKQNNLFSQATADVGGVDFPTNQILTASRRVDWLGTDRARIGFLIWPTFLAYGTGGLAYGQTRASVAIAQTVVFPGFFQLPSFGTFNHTLAGWTAGGGVEWLFSPNWSLKVE